MFLPNKTKAVAAFNTEEWFIKKWMLTIIYMTCFFKVA